MWIFVLSTQLTDLPGKKEKLNYSMWVYTKHRIWKLQNTKSHTTIITVPMFYTIVDAVKALEVKYSYYG